jgi:hypothetical protein
VGAVATGRDPLDRARVPGRESGTGLVARCQHVAVNELGAQERDRGPCARRKVVQGGVDDLDAAGDQVLGDPEGRRLHPAHHRRRVLRGGELGQERARACGP